MSKEEVLRLVKEHVPMPNPTPRGIGKEEVNKAVQEALAATQEENAERNAQVTDTINMDYVVTSQVIQLTLIRLPGT